MKCGKKGISKSIRYYTNVFHKDFSRWNSGMMKGTNRFEGCGSMRMRRNDPL
jgi:hypothetical protein